MAGSSRGFDGELLALAREHGVATSFEDWRHRQVDVPLDTVRAVLAALGTPARDRTEARDALNTLRARRSARLLPPTVVVRDRPGAPLTVALPARAKPVHARLQLEDGAEHDVDVDARSSRLRLPRGLPKGYHRLTVESQGDRQDSALVLAPQLAPLPAGRQRRWGWMLQLYALRSSRSWGMGDLADLRDLAVWSSRAYDADFVLCNPLHAPTPTPPLQSSPYYPSSRRFTDPMYLRVEDIPEVSQLSRAAAQRVRQLASSQQRGNRSDLLDRDAVFAAKQEALELVFRTEQSPARAAAFARYRAEEEPGLEDFATFCALAERHGPAPTVWPVELRHPANPAVRAARDELADRVDFHAWQQWLCDEQLAATQRAAVAAGMTLGMVHDLAVGVDPQGADAWALQDDLALGVCTGAPPDSFNQQGQDWGQPPLRPDRLAETGYAPFRAMLGSVLRHGGGIRVDHILGHFRLWLVPEGAAAAEGAYVRYPADDLLAILALEAERAGAVVVGEDLGTVEQGVRESLSERRILGSRVLYFERTPDGDAPLPAREYPELVLASVTTHDLPTATGWWADEGVRTQARLGLLAQDTDEESELEEHARRKEEMRALLRREGLVGDEPTTAELVVAMHRFLARTPALLLAAAPGDAIGDLEQPNLPGTVDAYPNWRLPLAVPDGGGRQPILLDELKEHPLVHRLAAMLAAERPRTAAEG